MSLVYNALKYFIALIFLTTSIGKLLDNRGFAAVLETYQLLPAQILLPFGLAISLVELVFGGLLISGRHMKWASLGALLSYVGYTALAVLTNVRGLNLTNCGCFGVFLARPMTWWTVLEDTILTAACFFLWRLCLHQELAARESYSRHE